MADSKKYLDLSGLSQFVGNVKTAIKDSTTSILESEILNLFEVKKLLGTWELNLEETTVSDVMGWGLDEYHNFQFGTKGLTFIRDRAMLGEDYGYSFGDEIDEYLDSLGDKGTDVWNEEYDDGREIYLWSGDEDCADRIKWTYTWINDNKVSITERFCMLSSEEEAADPSEWWESQGVIVLDKVSDAQPDTSYFE